MHACIYKIGFWSGLIAFTATLTYDVVQFLQVAGVVHYPLGEILIYSSALCIAIPFVLEILALHYITPPEKKFWSHGALVFTILYAVFVIANYVVQLATVLPMKLKGYGNEIALLDQTPHSLFWDFDALGYIFMGIAMFVAVPVFKKQGIEKWPRIAILANALVTPLITFVYFYPVYSEKLLFIGLPWAITAPAAMLSLSVLFKKRMKQSLLSQKE